MFLEEGYPSGKKILLPYIIFFRCFYKATEISIKEEKGDVKLLVELQPYCSKTDAENLYSKGNLREVDSAKDLEDLALTLQGGITGVSSQPAYC